MEKSIVEYFISLVKIDSESRNEKAIAIKLEKDLQKLGASTVFDDAGKTTGANTGNLYAFFPGDVPRKPLLFCSHMDTVVPGNNINPTIKGDRIVSDGTTILGGDDKSGIAEIIWGIKTMKEKGIPHAPIEVLFTISEEIGLLGAKNVNYDLLKSRQGYAFDGHQVGCLVTGAPSQNSIEYIIHGKEAHAGVEPEKGINAIKIAAEAIAQMDLGRISEVTTCNVGVIEGGKATNIVPNQVYIKAEVRSHDPEALNRVTSRMNEIIESTTSRYILKDYQASAEIKVKESYRSFNFGPDSFPVKLGLQASRELKLPSETRIGGGGSDANIFNAHGLEMVIAGTGMSNVHTVKEYLSIKDLQDGARWVEKILELYSRE